MRIVAVVVAACALGLVAYGCGSEPAKQGAASAPSWSFAARMLHRRSYTASAELGGKVYVAAGMVGNSGRPLDLFERFDPAKNEWMSLTPLPEKFSAGAAASFDGRIWVVGGNSETTAPRAATAACRRAPAAGYGTCALPARTPTVRPYSKSAARNGLVASVNGIGSPGGSGA